MKKLALFLGILLTVGLGQLGCGDDNNDGGSGTPGNNGNGTNNDNCINFMGVPLCPDDSGSGTPDDNGSDNTPPGGSNNTDKQNTNCKIDTAAKESRNDACNISLFRPYIDNDDNYVVCAFSRSTYSDGEYNYEYSENNQGWIFIGHCDGQCECAPDGVGVVVGDKGADMCTEGKVLTIEINDYGLGNKCKKASDGNIKAFFVPGILGEDHRFNPTDGT